MCKFHAYFFIKKYAKLACPLLYSGVPKTQQAVGKSIVSFQTFGYRLFFMKIHLFILSLRETNQIWEIMSECIEHPENAPEYEGLKVNKGIEQPDPMNPNIAARLKNIRRQTLTTDDYVEGILKGNKPGDHAGRKCQTRAPGRCPGSDQPLPALLRTVCTDRYHGCTGSRQEYFHRKFRKISHRPGT